MSFPDAWRWPHVCAEELACHRCRVIHGSVHPAVLDLFEAVRAECGGAPIRINSASRCEAHQQAVNPGVSRSPHLPWSRDEAGVWVVDGEGGVSFALDIQSSLYSGFALAAVAERLRPDSGIGSRMYGGGFCHIDVCDLAEGGPWRKGRRW